MAKREYNGDPIDITDSQGEQHITERSGETVAGTTSDDLFQESSNLLPDDLTEDDLSEAQKKAVIAFLTVDDKENVDFNDLAEGRDFSQQSARRGVHKVFRKYRDMDDLGDSYKLSVLILAHHGDDYKSIHSLANRYPVSRTVLGNAKRTYPDLIEERQPVTESGLKEAIEAYLKTHPSKRESYEDDESQSEENKNSQKRRANKNYPDDFSECQKWFIEAITDNPSYSVNDIAEIMPTNDAGNQKWSNANYYNYINNYSQLISDLIKTKGTASDKSDLSNYLQKNIPTDDIKKDSSKTASGNPENDPNGSDQAPFDGFDDIEKRLRAVESKVESLRHKVDEIDNEEQSSDRNDLAETVIGSLSDEQLGQILRGAMQND